MSPASEAALDFFGAVAVPIYFVLPFIILGWRNRFDDIGKTLLRCVVSAVVLWAYKAAAYALLYYVLYQDDTIPDGMYEPREVVGIFFGGWIISVPVTVIVWLLLESAHALRRFWQARRRAQGTSISNSKTNSSDNPAM